MFGFMDEMKVKMIWNRGNSKRDTGHQETLIFEKMKKFIGFIDELRDYGPQS